MVGFTDADKHRDVLARAAAALGLKCERKWLQLLCSGGIVPDSPIGDEPWSLGGYIAQNGGTQNRSKKVWGVAIPVGMDEAGPSTSDSVSVLINQCIIIRLICMQLSL